MDLRACGGIFCYCRCPITAGDTAAAAALAALCSVREMWACQAEPKPEERCELKDPPVLPRTTDISRPSSGGRA